MMTNSKILKAVLSVAMTAGLSATAFSQGDSSADASGFSDVQASTGVMIRVPINAQGQELSSAAELRVYKDSDTSAPADLFSAFAAATAVNSSQVASAGDTSTSYGDNGWDDYRGGSYYNNYGSNRYGGWQSNNYYYNYQPTYNYYGNCYSYSRPYYHDYYSHGGGYYGYRYYYYSRW